MDTHSLISKMMQQHGLTRSAAEELVREAMTTARKRKQVSEREAKRRSTDYLTFLNDVSPELDWSTAFARYIALVIDQVVDGTLINVAISLPPRTGKSEAVTKRLPVYWLERNPNDKVIVGAYNHTLAKLFTGDAMKMYRQRNPSDIDSEQEDEWTTIHGGMCIGVGVGSGSTGKGAGLLIIDDAVKSHAEAFSKAYRERVWNWYLNDIRSRRNNIAKVPQVVIGTRWHREDLIGKILEESDPGEWVEIRIPAIAKENDPLGRQPGESINPVRLPIASLEREKRLLGPRFESLYQQDPIDESGTLFNIDKLIEVKDVPREAHRVRAWDRAASEGKGDWTVGILMAYDNNGICYIEDIVRDRLSKDNVRARMKSTLIDDLQKYGNIEGYTFKTYFEREPAGDGMTAAEDIVRMMAPYPIYWDRPSDNKAARWAGFAVAVNAGNVKVKIAPWVRDFKDELARIVEGIDNKQDDQCDSASLAYNKLAIENAIVTVN